MVVLNSPTRKVLPGRALIAVATAAVVPAGCYIHRPADPEVEELEEQRRRGTVARELDVSIGTAQKVVEQAFENLEIELVSVKDHESSVSILGSSEPRRAEVKARLEVKDEYATCMEVNARKWLPEDEDSEGTVTIWPRGGSIPDIGVSIRGKVDWWDKSYAIEIADEVSRLLETGETGDAEKASLP